MSHLISIFCLLIRLEKLELKQIKQVSHAIHLPNLIFHSEMDVKLIKFNDMINLMNLMENAKNIYSGYMYIS